MTACPRCGAAVSVVDATEDDEVAAPEAPESGRAQRLMAAFPGTYVMDGSLVAFDVARLCEALG